VPRLLLVCIGSAAGGGARYLMATALHARLGAAFPWGTLAVNIVGSFLIAVVMRLSIAGGGGGVAPALIGPDARLFLTTGVLGGFTTYSSFNHETLAMVERGAWLAALLHVAVTVLGCLGSGALGLLAARTFAG
jgi:CrcB protein